jgi:hypothetical protein
MKKARLMTLLALCPVILLGGCNLIRPTEKSEVVPKPEEVIEPMIEPMVEPWAISLSQFKLVPVLPAREDIRVGDVFLSPVKDSSAELGLAEAISVAKLPRWGTVDVLEALQDDYRLRGSFPRTPDPFLQISEEPQYRDWVELEPARSREGSIFSPEDTTTRLRIVDLQLSSIIYDGAGLNGMVPTEAVNVAFGTAWQDDKVVMFKVGAAESYTLSLGRLLPNLVTQEDGVYQLVNDELIEQLSLPMFAGASEIYVNVISEVVFVRSLDISIQADQAFDEDDELLASELDEHYEEIVHISEEDIEDADGEDEIETEETVLEETVIKKDHALDPIYAAYARARAINEVLIDTDADDVPGGFIRFLNVMDDSVTVRRFWQRGLAIGVRGIRLRVDRATGQVQAIDLIQP